MNNLERLISLLSDPTQVTNEEIQTAYGCFMEQLRTASQSEQNYSEVFRMLNDTRIELVSLQTFQRYEQGKNALKNPYLLKAILLLESEIELLKLQIHYSHIGKPEKCSIMKDKIEKIVRELNASIQVGEVELYNIVQNAPAMILMMENAFDELKTLVSEYKFPSFDEEITFFKYTKPILFSKLIYLRKIYYLEIKRPISNFATIRTYLEKEHEQINGFCNKNAEFIQYYRSGQSCFDEYYFLRGRHEMDLNLESFYFERDPKFSTNFDFKVAKLLANDMLAAYLNCELSKLKYQEENGYQINEELPPTQWTDKKTALGELIYSIHEEKSINAGMIEIKALATIFGRIFKVDLSDIYHIFLEIRSRKTNRTEYLNRLVKALTRRMDDADSR